MKCLANPKAIVEEFGSNIAPRAIGMEYWNEISTLRVFQRRKIIYNVRRDLSVLHHFPYDKSRRKNKKRILLFSFTRFLLFTKSGSSNGCPLEIEFLFDVVDSGLKSDWFSGQTARFSPLLTVLDFLIFS